MKAKGALVFLCTKSATQKPYENRATELVLELRCGSEAALSDRHFCAILMYVVSPEDV